MMKLPRKILAIKLRSLGDTVLMTAPLAELKRAYPDAQVHVLINASWAPLLENHPDISRIWVYERHQDPASRAKALTRLAFRLRREHYDFVINFHASPSSATLAFATGSKVRSIHFHGHKDRNRYSTVEIPGKGTLKPIIERDMDALRALGLRIPECQLPKLHIKQSELDLVTQRFASSNLRVPILALGLGASRPAKAWPIDRFAALAVSWCQKKEGSALALVAESEAAIAHEFLKVVDDALRAVVNNTYDRARIRSRIICEIGLPLRQLAATLKQCKLFVGNDSGPKHIAVAAQTPTLTLFGPEHPFEWHPYLSDLHPYIFVEGLSCRRDSPAEMPPWCGTHVCANEQHRCMRQIGVEEVLSKSLQLAEQAKSK